MFSKSLFDQLMNLIEQTTLIFLEVKLFHYN